MQVLKIKVILGAYSLKVHKLQVDTLKITVTSEEHSKSEVKLII